jgi:hypothetical protein
LISSRPSPPASAIAEPDMPEKIRLAVTLTWPSPPVKWPTRARAKPKMRSVTPPVFIAMPARMKQGTASSGKESMPPISRCGAEVIVWPSIISQTMPMKMSENATGMLAMTSASHAAK